MLAPTKKMSDWFVQKLIELRKDIDGEYTDISFGLDIFDDYDSLEISEGELFDKVKLLLKEIRGYHAKNFKSPVDSCGLSFIQNEGGSVTLIGYTTEILNGYLKRNLKETGIDIIEKRGGVFFYNEKLVHFKNPNADYFKIFESAIDLAPRGGSIDYGTIIKDCKKKGLKNLTPAKIQRALTGKSANLFRDKKYIKQHFDDDAPALFTADSKGKYLTFNNKK